MIRIVFTSADAPDRARMAAAFFNAFADSRIARAIAASERTDRALRPDVTTAMREAGIDLRDDTLALLDLALLRDARMWIVLGRDAFDLAAPPNVRRIRWNIDDGLDVRAARDAIRIAVRGLITDAGWGPGVWL